MTVLGWCALAGVFVEVGPGRAWRARLAWLARMGRLASPEQPRPGSIRWLGPASAWAGAVVLVSAMWAGCGVVLAAAGAIALGTCAVLVRTALRRRAARLADTRHGEALRLVLAELQAGARLAQALRAAAEVDPDPAWARAARVHADGGDPADVLIGCPRTAAVGQACRVAGRTGASLTDVLGRLAADHVAAVDQRRAVAAALAGAHSSAAVLAALPVVGVGLGAAMGVHPVSTLLHTNAGHVLCLLGVAFDAAGVLWTARIVRSAERP